MFWQKILNIRALIQYKMLSYQYRKSHCEDKTVVRLFYLHNGNLYMGKTTFLFWISPQISQNNGHNIICIYISVSWCTYKQHKEKFTGIHMFLIHFKAFHYFHPCEADRRIHSNLFIHGRYETSDCHHLVMRPVWAPINIRCNLETCIQCPQPSVHFMAVVYVTTVFLDWKFKSNMRYNYVLI